ncbi:shikimate kinase [Pullulanibacillus camelliae]|uniref:Shikimate kinase n=1 Tax=Pullulanibacillus camelliae TaxID=1707096 RepID=A0A8J3DWJ1_9BACL|nr:shikimate kinase [Pullulanibacillus camelliae]GGE46691.1 shikimate kinase [Pullulanibacillus camelliae]
MNTIFLIGFMGAGKTTIGKNLSQRLSMNVVDTDDMIEKVCQKTINDIFKEEGEEAFRHHESTILKELSWPETIVTTGGGIIKNPENRQFMHQQGIVIYLHTDPRVVLERTADDDSRPLLAQNRKQRITRLLNERLPQYLEADYTVNTSMKSVDTITEEIAGFLARDRRFRA